MSLHKQFVAGMFAFTAIFPLALPAGPAHAQSSASNMAAPRIDGFDVEPAAQLTVGNELVFTLYGTAGGTARVRIVGASGSLLLDEVEAGVYEGTHTIRKQDRITAGSSATANLRIGNKVASSILDESLVATTDSRRSVATASSTVIPRIDRFGVEPPSRLVAGSDLIFTLSGSPGGVASVRIAGVKGKLALDEVRQGVYEGTYTIKDRDRIATDAAVTANLRSGNQEVSALLGQALMAGAASPSSQRRAASMCAACGVIEAVNVVEVKGDGSYIGMIAGGLAGVLVGSQIGQGRGNTAAEIAGAAGGAFAGNEIEKRMKTNKHYEVVVRLENGGSQTVSYAAEPAFRVGDRVKVENGTLTRNQS